MQKHEAFFNSFRDIQSQFSRLYAHLLERADLSLPQYALLSLLHHQGEMPMTQASTKLHITKPAVTHLVDRLERAKMLNRMPHPKDRRSYLLKIEKRGSQLVEKIQLVIFELMFKTLDHFRPQEKELISRFYADLSKDVAIILETPRRRAIR